jgi:hypothetical protein
MKFHKFLVINPKESLSNKAHTEVEILFNLDHIVSIKPIRIATSERLINGFWIRTTNGKKYKATKIPQELLGIIGEQYSAEVMSFDSELEESAVQ